MAFTMYVAAPFGERLAGIHARRVLEEKGFDVTARWLDTHLQEDGLTPEQQHLEAMEDLLDIHRSEGFVLLNSYPCSYGRNIELGFALARGKRIWLVGERTSIFHYHHNVTVVKRVEDIEL